MESGKYDFLRCNYPNGDMVGHTGAHVCGRHGDGVRGRQPCGRILEAADQYGYTVAYHGRPRKCGPDDRDEKGQDRPSARHTL